MNQPMKKAPLCPKMYQGWGGVGHVGVGWCVPCRVGWGGVSHVGVGWGESCRVGWII